MKRMQLLSALLLIAITSTVIGCQPSRVWATKEKVKKEKLVKKNPAQSPGRYYNPGAAASVSLILSPTPGFVMNRYADGRYYHRNQQGLLYWKGHDNRFFLDKSYLNRVNYSQQEYEQWKRYNRG